MNRGITFKDHFSESRQFMIRAVWMLVFIVLLLAVTIARLAYLQVFNHRHFSTLSNDNRVKLLATPPTRGLIYDRKGTLLAENLPAYRLEITPEQVRDMDTLLADLRHMVEISDEDLARFHRHLGRKRPFESAPLRFYLSDEEVARLAALRHRLPGVNIVARLGRHYPLGKTVSHVLGYVGRIDERDLRHLDATNYRGTSYTGKTGIEKQYEQFLHGSVGHRQVEANAQGRILRTLQETAPAAGRNLYLTLDADLQRAAESALGKYSGAIVALAPATGEVLALVSKPGYDPNAFVRGISTTDYLALQNHREQPLYNRALLGQYPPGSTLKPFLGLAGLEYGVADRHQEVFCPGYYVLPGEERRFRDWKREGHGHMDLDEAITQSCDVYFYDLARRLGIDRIHTFLRQFGFGQSTGIDMTIEREGLLPSREWKRRQRGMVWFPGETLNTGIGQGYTLTTPLQLAVATATLATRGRRTRPHLVYGMEDPANGEMTINEPEVLAPVEGISPDSWAFIMDAMTHVVHAPRGTGWRLRDAPYQIAGKTGTAQVFGIEQEEEYEEEDVARELRDHALFIAFAPAQEPQIALAVVVENGGSGGSVAAPIAREVLDHYLLKGDSR